MRYGTITSNGVATAKDAKPPNESQNLEQVTLQTRRQSRQVPSKTPTL